MSTLLAGTCVGHIAILGLGPQPATVWTATTSLVFLLGHRELVGAFFTMQSVRGGLLPDVPDDEALAHVRTLRATGREAWKHVTLPKSGLPSNSAWPKAGRAYRPRRVPGTLSAAVAAFGRAPPLAPARPLLPALSRRAKVAAAAVAVAALAGGVFTYHLPILVVRAGRPFNAVDDIEIRGVPVYRPHGQYLVLSVDVERPTLAGLVGGIGEHRRVMATRNAVRRDPKQYRELYRKSEAIAAAVAERSAGIDPGAPAFSIRFRRRPLGGPSAGLTYALAKADLLDPQDRTQGRAIAVTGTLGLDGSVGVVGGLEWKADAARSRRAAMLLAPKAEAGLLPRTSLPVRGVQDFSEALASLRAA